MKILESLESFWLSTGIANLSWGQLVMIGIGFLLIYLAIARKFEPLLLVPIGFGGILSNVPIADIAGASGFIGQIYNMGIATSLFPLFIFIGVGALIEGLGAA